MNLDDSNPYVTETDIAFSGLVGTYWTHFAKYHDPNGEGIPDWPTFSNNNPAVLYLGSDVRSGPVPDEASLKVMDNYFEWRRSPQHLSAQESDGTPAIRVIEE